MLPSIKKRRVEDGAATGDNESATNHSENDVVMLSTDKTSSSTALTTSNNVESLCTLLNKKSTTITNLSNSLEAFLKVILEKDDLSESMPLLKKAMMMLSIYRSRIDMKAILKTLKDDKEGVVKFTIPNNVNTLYNYFSPMSGRTINDTGFSLSRYAFLSILKFLQLKDVMKWMRVNKQMKSLIDSHEGGIIIAPDLSILPDKERMTTMTLLKKRVLNRPFFQYVEAIELPINEKLRYKITEPQLNVITSSLAQLSQIKWPKHGNFWNYNNNDSLNNMMKYGILEPENILVIPDIRFRPFEDIEINEGIKIFKNALAANISFESYWGSRMNQLRFPNIFYSNLISLNIECDDCDYDYHREWRRILKATELDALEKIVNAMKNLKCLKDFRFPYAKKVFTEKTIFEAISNNHPCIERLSVYMCQRFPSKTCNVCQTLISIRSLKEFHIHFDVERLLKRQVLRYEERINNSGHPSYIQRVAVREENPRWIEVKRLSKGTQTLLNESDIHWFVNDEKMLVNPNAHVIKSQNYQKINPLHDAIVAFKAQKLLQNSPLEEPLSGLTNIKQMYDNNDYKSMSKFIHKKIAAEMKKDNLNTDEVVKLQKSLSMLERKYNKVRTDTEKEEKDNFMNGLSVENPYVELLGFYIPISIFLHHILRCLPFDEIVRCSIVDKSWRSILRDPNNTKAIQPPIVDFDQMRTNSIKKFEEVIKAFEPQHLILPQNAYTQTKFLKKLNLVKHLSNLNGINFDIKKYNYQLLLDVISEPEKITTLGKLHIELSSNEKLNELRLIIEKFSNVTSLNVKFWYPLNIDDNTVHQAVNERLCKILKLMRNSWSNLTTLEVAYDIQGPDYFRYRINARINQRIGPLGNFFESFVMQLKKLTLLKLSSADAETLMIKYKMEPESWQASLPLLQEFHLLSKIFPEERIITFLVNIKSLTKIHLEMTYNPFNKFSWQGTHDASSLARMQLCIFSCCGGNWTTNIQKFKQLPDMKLLTAFKAQVDAMKHEIKTLHQQVHENQENAITRANTRTGQNDSRMMMMTPGNPLDLRTAPTSTFTSGNDRFNNFGSGSSSTNTNNMMMMPMHNTNFSNSNLRSRGSNGNSSNNNMMMMMPMHNNP